MDFALNGEEFIPKRVDQTFYDHIQLSLMKMDWHSLITAEK